MPSLILSRIDCMSCIENGILNEDEDGDDDDEYNLVYFPFKNIK